MALVVADRVKETTTTTGTGAITLAGATANFVTFSSVLSNGDTTYYAIVDDANTDFEVGLGTYASSGNTLTRTTVLSSTNSGSAVNLSAGSKEVFINYPAGKSVYLDGSGQLVIGGTAVTATAAELNYVDGVTSNIQTQIDAINPSPKLTATASGTLANGDTVIVNSNGTVSAVSGSSVTEGLGTPAVFETARTDYTYAVYDSNTQKVVIPYRDAGNSGYGTAVVGTVSGTSISFGTPAVFESASTYYVSAAYDTNAQKVVIGYQDSTNSEYGTAVVGTVSGTSISFGTPVVYRSAATLLVSATYDINAQKVVLAYRDNSSTGYAIVGTVSGTSISFGSQAQFESGNTSHIASAYDANAQKHVVAYTDGGDADKGKAAVGTVSGTSISFGTPVQFDTGGVSYNAVAYDASAQKVVIAYKDVGNSSYGTAIVGTVSGTSISFGTPVIFASATAEYIASGYDVNAGKLVIAYRNGSSSDHGTVVSGTVSGTSISFGTPIVFESAATRYISIAYDANVQKNVIAYSDEGNSDYGTGIVYQNASVSTNLTAENYIGISDAAYSNSATATIQIVGSVDDAQSSLTAGQQYFVQVDGSLGLTAADPSVFAGTAVSATKLIVKG